jgi:hypothetical protein
VTTTAPTTTPAASPLADPGTIDHEDFYDVVVDTATWPANTTKTAPTTPVSMGQVAMATYHSDGKGGLSVPVIVVPTLDTLLADINKAQPAGAQLAALYRSTVLVNKTGTLTGTVTFASAATVALLSDQAPKDENAALPTKNLTFAGIKSAVKIPVLYQSAAFSFSWDFNDISGAVYEFDPSTVGNTGMRHWFGTSTAPAPVSLVRAAVSVNAAAAKTTAHTVATGASVPAGTHVGPTVAAVTAKPAAVTRQLAAAQPLTIQGIASIPGYSEDSVHKQSQTLLQNMMYYHMNESDRTTFLNYPKPTNLPDSLGVNLDSTLKTWIHDTYAPAYISFMLSQVAPGSSKSWRVNFDQTENNKIWYWWSGSVSLINYWMRETWTDSSLATGRQLPVQAAAVQHAERAHLAPGHARPVRRHHQPVSAAGQDLGRSALHGLDGHARYERPAPAAYQRCGKSSLSLSNPSPQKIANSDCPFRTSTCSTCTATSCTRSTRRRAPGAAWASTRTSCSRRCCRTRSRCSRTTRRPSTTRRARPGASGCTTP